MPFTGRLVPYFALAAVCAAVLGAPAVLAGPSTNVPLGHPVYRFLDRLDTQGFINSRIATIRPLSREEVARLLLEAGDAVSARDASLDALREEIRLYGREFRAETAFLENQDEGEGETYWKPLQRLYLRFAFRDGPTRPEGEAGRLLTEGTNLLARASTHAKALDVLALGLDGEILYNAENHPETGGDETTWRFNAAYLKLAVINLELLGGIDQMAWGPLGHAGLLLSDEAEPLQLLKVSNPQPALLPWFFSALGPLKYELFFTELGGAKHRHVPHPFFAGMKVSLRPMPWLELGFSRTFLFDGKTVKKPGTGDLWRILFGFEESEDEGEAPVADQRTGLDGRVRLTMLGGGVALHWEAFGENVSNLLPYRWSWRVGLHLAGFPWLHPSLEIRAEWTRTHEEAYTHPVYRTGYLYKGVPLGHHAGGGAEDVWVEVGLTPLPGIFAAVAVDWERRSNPPSGGRTWERYEVGGRISGTVPDLPGLHMTAWLAFLHNRNAGFEAGRDDEEIQLSIEVRYEF